MINEVIFKIKQDRNFYTFLKYNSYWYEILSMNPNRYKDFIKDFKEKNNLTLSAKINNLSNKISFLMSLFEVIN